MRSIIIGTAGHIDHGKTALVRALTGVDADRLPEEKRRGLTIDLGFAYATLPDGTELGFVDVPGHERFLPNMLAGVLSIDRVLLIVAADAERAARPPAGRFRMPIDRAFTLPGIGLVVTGTVAAGMVTTGDRLVVSPHGAEIRIRGIHSQNRPVERAGAGERCALNIAGTFAEGAEPGRGDWVQAAELHKPTSRI